MKRLLIILPLIFWISSAHAEIYSWTDPKGTAHYVNSLDDVPLRYRPRMKVQTYDNERKGEAAPQPGQMPVKHVMPVMPQLDPKGAAGGIQAQPVLPTPPAYQEQARIKMLERKRARRNAVGQ